MKKAKLLLTVASLLSVCSLTSCGKKYDVTLTVYNSEDYIYLGEDEDGKKVDDSTIEAFEKYYQEKTGKSIHVNYETFLTNEDMHTMIKSGQMKADIVCPSDYMIQTMQREGLLANLGYNKQTKKYGDELDNINKNTSPYIKDLFHNNDFSEYAVPYFWGTMGFTYNPEKVDEEAIQSWEFQWKPIDKQGKSLANKITVKDSMRDTYFTAVMHVYKTELDTFAAQYEAGTLTAAEYNAKLSEIFNRHDAGTMEKVGKALNELRDIVGLEVDQGKSDIVKGNIVSCLAWSGDSVFSMNTAENSDVQLNYVIPKEGSNVWFDGWCVLKDGNVEVAKEFLNFLAIPEVAAKNMEATGYTSPIAGDAIWDLVNDWYAADDDAADEDVDEIDLSYFFKGSLSEGKEAKIRVLKENRGRQFDAQFPEESVINRCAVMKDFGEEGNLALYNMWSNFK